MLLAGSLISVGIYTTKIRNVRSAERDAYSAYIYFLVICKQQ